MPSAETSSPPGPSPRLKRIMALVYGVEGVTAARVWQWDQEIAVAVRGRPSDGTYDLLHRVESAVASVRDPSENWEFGLLVE